MKFATKLLLFIFITFLSTPTIVSVIEKNTDISMFYNFSEEEIHKDLKESKVNFKNDLSVILVAFTQVKNSKIISENLSKHDNASEEIFSPPPELV